MKHPPRETVEAAVEKTMSRLERLKAQEFDPDYERNVLRALAMHFAKVGQDELADAVDEIVLGFQGDRWTVTESEVNTC